MSCRYLLSLLTIIFATSPCLAQNLSPNLNHTLRDDLTSYSEFVTCLEKPCDIFTDCFNESYGALPFCEANQEVVECSQTLGYQAASCAVNPDKQLQEFFSTASLVFGLPEKEAGKIACTFWTSVFLVEPSLVQPAPWC